LKQSKLASFAGVLMGERSTTEKLLSPERFCDRFL